MTCGNKGCKVKARIDPKSGLCPGCNEFVQGVNRRVDGLDRRQQARDTSHAARRDISGEQDEQDVRNDPPPPPGNNVFNYPPNSQAPLPNVDLNDITKSYEDIKKGAPVDSGKVLGDMLGMIVHMYAKQSENDATKEQVNSNTDRISQLEAKVGDANEVAYPRSIAIRKLPLPPHGVSELQNVQHYLKEIKAHGVDVIRDCVKAIRNEAMKHNPNFGPNLGTVLVELRNEEVRGNIMKAKKNLMNHPALVLQNLIIKNALSPAEMKAQNTNLGMLKMITGSNDYFIAGNGMIKQKDQQNFQYENQKPPQPRSQVQQIPPSRYQQNFPTRSQSQADHTRLQITPNFQPQIRNSQPQFQMHQQGRPPIYNSNSAPNFPQFQIPAKLPVFNSNFAPNFPQFQLPAKLPVLNSTRAATAPNPENSQACPPFQFNAQLPARNPPHTAAATPSTASKQNEFPANPVLNLLDFDFAPVQPGDEPRSTSARSQSPTAGTSYTEVHHGNSQSQ